MEKVTLPKILIIGENSLIGSTLLTYVKDNFEVYSTHHNSKINKKNSVQIDLVKEPQKLVDLITKIKPNFVVHTVAYPNVDFCEKNHDAAYFLHVIITKKIAHACSSVNAKLLYFSTDAVFDGIEGKKFSELDTTNPLSYYGKTKLEAEKVIMKISENNLVFRTTVIYGPFYNSRFTSWVLDNLKQNKPVPAFTDQLNTPTLVDDLCKFIVHAFSNNLSGIFHAVGKTCLSRYDFALRLAQKFNFDQKLIVPTISSETNQVAPRPKNGCLDATKLEKLLNFDFCDIDEGIQFIKDHQP
ncbi:dTDP-4-dehydrorhamnose reductase protein [Marine Group I thaumarchaeote SCGC AAA799-P11]|uniref:dTDP-4-dehydrorhamnose reductase protein n=1 Tax=Marine Group I thaumarchaeote SCGC AAA799-P11 TaxID=1502295 RepID=A0A087S2Y5_9ARCH|nr:dTDP-4-dehydrorhamnose reductase protein [Marine Group I thaumarchaeote SCGC AAA799-P11]